MSAFIAIRFNPPLQDKYDSLRRAGKHAKVAIAATLPKLLVLANAFIIDQRKMDPKPRGYHVARK
ncbi:hypothetical protein [Sinorhizobium mexicanum]|uniref:Uncharacterized protein n=1 Tax=Sinorhizobium mexicanum TaxID=375549 RepID=A0A859QGF7_9HYPH|nr:hypothetical protein [Sinorhizobium mexicanum]MBP1884852.1 hypothetical protein [Sinorhizobium mexicanum]QLL64502.1 hypothetical protein FKV68_24155 [Sinorhizobium mexicanum]